MSDKCPKSYLVESIIATVLCCFPVGIFGVLNAYKVDGYYRKGQYELAKEASLKAKKFFVITLIVGLIFWGISITYYFVNIAGQATYFEISDINILVGPRGVNYCILVESNGKWDVDNSCSWIIATRKENEVRIKVRQNTTGTERNGWVTVSSKLEDDRIYITQTTKATFIKAEPSTYVINRNRRYSYLEAVEEKMKRQKMGLPGSGIWIQTDGLSWSATGPEFCTVERVDDSVLNVRIHSDVYGKHTGRIVVTSDGVSCTIPITFIGKCEKCHGEGYYTCPKCKGNGRYTYSSSYWVPSGWSGYWATSSEERDCDKCDQRGTIDCEVCGGKGYYE